MYLSRSSILSNQGHECTLVITSQVVANSLLLQSMKVLWLKCCATLTILLLFIYFVFFCGKVLYCCFWRLKLSVHRRDTSQSAAVQASSICSLCVCFSPDLEVWLCLAAVCHTHEQGMPAGRIRKRRGEIGKSTRDMGLKAVHPCRDSTWNSRHILGEENIMVRKLLFPFANQCFSWPQAMTGRMPHQMLHFLPGQQGPLPISVTKLTLSQYYQSQAFRSHESCPLKPQDCLYNHEILKCI
ncbi:unnamed protein product [Eretmochelys imbricata]